MNIKPFGNKIIVGNADKYKTKSSKIEVITVEEKTANYELLVGEVLAVGPEVTSVNVNDWVVFLPTTGSLFDVDGTFFKMIKEDGIIGTVKKEEFVGKEEKMNKEPEPTKPSNIILDSKGN